MFSSQFTISAFYFSVSCGMDGRPISREEKLTREPSIFRAVGEYYILRVDGMPLAIAPTPICSALTICMFC